MNIYSLDDYRRAIDRRAKKLEAGKDPGEPWAVEQLNTDVVQRALRMQRQAERVAETQGREAGMREIDAAVRAIGTLHQQHPAALLLDVVRSLLSYRQRLASRRTLPPTRPAA